MSPSCSDLAMSSADGPELVGPQGAKEHSNPDS